MQELIDRQLDSLKESESFTWNDKNTDELYRHLENGKSLMDEIRESIGARKKCC
jgi:hypothetical protein